MTSSLDELGGWPAIFGALAAGENLAGATAEAVLNVILSGDATEGQIGAFTMGLLAKGETADEISGMVNAMRSAQTPLKVDDEAIDIVGMGGSPQRRKAALNVSTMACFIASAAGAVICKHGNRKASSTSGSFDLLEALGIHFELTPEQLQAVVADSGVGFAFAKAYHPALRHAGPVRTQLGVRTVFNTLGPLANPARVTRQVVGIADSSLAPTMIDILEATGSVHSWVVSGHGSLDEIALDGPTLVHSLRNGEKNTFTLNPADYDMSAPPAGALDGGDAVANAAILGRLLDGETGPIRDIVVLNAAAGLVVADIAADLAEGIEAANSAIDSGAAKAKLEDHTAAANSHR